MNEEIIKLIYTANLEGLADMMDCESGEEGIGIQVLGRFAELIVRECAKLADENTLALIDNQVGNTIKEHFGIKEK
jgi:hypothetical protein